MGVAYQGSDFHGFASQPKHHTIQAALEAAIGNCANHPVRIQCAGRTDRGVHATSQVIHFDSPSARSERAWLMGVNTMLPKSIRITWVQAVPNDFHARYDAVHRRYHYAMYRTDWAPCGLDTLATAMRWPLDVAAMRQAAAVLVGEHDFSAFRGSDCQSKSPVRRVHHLRILEEGPWLLVDIEANAFVMHMVRNIVGSLLAVGRGQRPMVWLGEVLASRDRRLAASMAPAEGLYLTAVAYDRMVLPSANLSLPWFLPKGLYQPVPSAPMD